MEPELFVRREIDPAARSRPVRGLVPSMSIAGERGAIGLTQSGAMDRKFVHGAAGRFDRPGHSRDERSAMDKVLDEIDLPPLWPVHDLLLHLGRVRRDRGTSKLTKRGRELTGRPGARVDLTAPVYLHRYVPDERARERGGVPGNCPPFRPDSPA